MAQKRKSRSRISRSRTNTTTPEQGGIPTWAWFAGGGVLAILLVVGLFWLDSQSLRGGVNATKGIEGAIIMPDLGRSHQEGDIHYAADVPTGGTHNANWQNCGIYDQPVREENVLHSMEHGAVWIAYDPTLPAEEIEQLQQLVRDERAKLRTFYVLAPKEEISAPIVATAWRVQLELENAFDDRLLKFMQRFHVGQFAPERGATCSGGIGEPL